MLKAAHSSLFADTATHATYLGVNDAGEDSASHWIMLLPAGQFSGRDGRGPYTLADLQAMRTVIEASSRRAGSTELVVDYDHQSVFSSVPGVGGLAPAAGWIKELDARPDGLYGRVEWTEKAAQAIRAKEYRYISPVYRHSKDGKVLHLVSAGLTNTPNLDLAAVAARSHPNSQETDMDKLIEALGLAQGAAEADVLTAVNSLLSSVAAIAVAAGVAKDADTETIVTAIQSASTTNVDPARFVPVDQFVAVQRNLKTLTEKLADDEAEMAVSRAIESGQLTPAARAWGLSLHKSNPAAFADYLKTAPQLTAAQRTASAVPPANGEPSLSETDLAVMRQMGLTKEAMIKAKKGGDA